MWKGWIIDESLRDTSFLSKLKVIRTYEEDNTEGDEKRIWKLLTVEVEDKEIEKIVKKLEKSIKPEYYAHFTDGDNLLIVFVNKSFSIGLEKVGKEGRNGITYFKIKPKEKSAWQLAFKYGTEKGQVDPRYIIKVE